MDWDEESLRGLSVPEEAIAPLLEAHQCAMTALSAERDEAQRQLEALRTVQAEATARAERQAREQALLHALTEAGAAPDVAPLLARTATENSAEVADAVRQLTLAYPTLFDRPLTPPVRQEGALSRERIAGMTEEEINGMWREVREALR